MDEIHKSETNPGIAGDEQSSHDEKLVVTEYILTVKYTATADGKKRSCNVTNLTVNRQGENTGPVDTPSGPAPAKNDEKSLQGALPSPQPEQEGEDCTLCDMMDEIVRDFPMSEEGKQLQLQNPSREKDPKESPTPDSKRAMNRESTVTAGTPRLSRRRINRRG